MEKKRNNLITAIQLWLEKNDLTTDTTFYTIAEWKEREEPYHNESEFVITTEGALFEILNFGYDQQAEFEDLVLSFDFFFELGNAWNLGFYYDQVAEKEVKFKSYSEKLRDQRWIDKRDLVKSNANHQCQDCGSTYRLEVHHCYYQFGREPWEYSFDSLRCLCRNCHERRGKLETILRAKFADLTFDELDIFRKLISSSILSFNRNAFFGFLSAIGHDHDGMDVKYQEMKSLKRFQ